jgi:hypothetical protein
VADTPLIPVFTNYAYYDHHWIQWLPDHPVYEAIEAQVYERDGGERFIRVFLTERAPPKRQTYFFSDAETAARWTAGRAFSRDIQLESRVNGGGARDLVLRLTDADGAPLEWIMEFDAGDRVASHGSGLRRSQGHAADVAYIFHYYGDSAIAARARLTLGGTVTEYRRTPDDFARPGPKTGYTAGSYTPVIRLGAFACSGEGAGVRCDHGRFFAPVVGAAGTLRTAPFGFTGLNTIDVTLAGTSVGAYTHHFDDHAFRFTFEPALPPLARLRGGERFAFAVSLDDGAPIVRGQITTTREGDAVTLQWRPDTPAWG